MKTRFKLKYMLLILQLLIIFLYGVVFSSISNLNEYLGEEKKIKAELLFNIGSDEPNEDFYKPKYFTVDSEGHIYVLDSGNSRIQCFSSEGKFLYSFGYVGQGPGGLSKGASKLKLLEDGNLYVIDNVQRRITVYSKNGEYQNSFKTYLPYHDIVLKNKTYYLSSLILDEEYRPIHFSDDLNKINKSFGFLIEPTPDIIKKVNSLPGGHNMVLKNEFAAINNFTNIIVNSEGQIIYSQSNPYHLVKYSKDGRKIKEIIGKVDFDTSFRLEITIREGGKRVDKKVVLPISRIYELILLGDDQFIVPVMSPDRSFIYLDVYNSDCIQIARYKLTNIFFDCKKSAGITNIHIDRNFNFYCLVTSSEDMPRLSKYKLMFNKNNH